MNTDIKTIKALPDFKLQVELADGSRGVFDLRPHLGHPGMAALTDPAYFSRVFRRETGKSPRQYRHPA